MTSSKQGTCGNRKRSYPKALLNSSMLLLFFFLKVAGWTNHTGLGFYSTLIVKWKFYKLTSLIMPLSVRMKGTTNEPIRYRPQFKFLNCIVDNPEFLNLVASSWNLELSGTPMYVVWNKLKRLQVKLKPLIRQATSGVQNIQESRKFLAQA